MLTKVFLFTMIISCFGIQEYAHAQITKDSLLENIINLKPSLFDDWLMQNGKSTKEFEKPLIQQKLIKERIKRGLVVSDDAIFMVLDLWRKHDRNKLRTIFLSDIDSLGTVSYIDSLLPILYKRNLTTVFLIEARRNIIKGNFGKGYSDPLKDQVDLINLSNGLRSKLILTYYSACNDLGKSYLDQEDLKSAEEYFRQTLSYPFYIEPDRGLMKQLRDLYIVAGKGMLKVRRNDLTALENTFFIPATRYVLDSLKVEFIDELKK